MRASCLTFGRGHTLRVWRPRESKPGPGPRGPLKSLGCRSRSDRRSRKSRGAVCFVGAPLRCAEASPSSLLLASGPAALATPPHTLFQQPASLARKRGERMTQEPYITCRELIEFLHLYLDGELPPERVVEFERHLSVCDSCVHYL